MDGSHGFDWETIAGLLDNLEDAERESLQAELERIETQLAHRHELYEQNVGELEWQLSRYEKELEEEYGRFGQSSDRTEELKIQIRELKHRIRAERRQHWDAIQELERERRDLLHLVEDDVDQALHTYLT